MYNYFIRTNLRNVVVTSDSLEGIAIIERPENHRNFSSVPDIAFGLPLLALGLPTIRKMITYQSKATRKQKELIKEPFWYLRMIAIDPMFQHKGYASRLLKPALEEARIHKQPVFLETHNKNNLPLYEHLGFAIIDQTIMEDSGLVHYCMRTPV